MAYSVAAKHAALAHGQLSAKRSGFSGSKVAVAKAPQAAKARGQLQVVNVAQDVSSARSKFLGASGSSAAAPSYSAPTYTAPAASPTGTTSGSPTTKVVNTTTITGYVTAIDVANATFTVTARSGDSAVIRVSENTWMKVIKNLNEDGDVDRIPKDGDWSDSGKVRNYLKMGQLVIAQAVELTDGAKTVTDARTVHIQYNGEGKLRVEEKEWWKNQIKVMANKWCDYVREDFFNNYRTNISFEGTALSDMQEMATLSRLIYGFASAYLMTGNARFYRHAKLGVEFQREAFRRVTTDGKYCFWSYGVAGGREIFGSQNGDDLGQLPLYEQIYALAGMTQYYRISYDPDVLQDIIMTVDMFDDFYLDKSPLRGYFSHVDVVSFKFDDPALGDNCAQKNWNSIGDHIPAYLINLVCAIEPIPAGSSPKLDAFVKKCQWILKETTDLILTKFPDPTPGVPYVNERFYADWSPWQNWRWQQNGAVCGHDLKIAWNMTRSANYFHDKDPAFAKSLDALSAQLGRDLGLLGVDQYRGGLFDVVERSPKNGMWLDFRFWDTKDFWQQEQAILAYYIMYGRTKDEDFLKLAREQTAFYNTFFLNHDDNSVYFRTSGDGLPYMMGEYRQAGGHSKSGYHAFELCLLCDLYMKTYVTKDEFAYFFKPTNAPRENPLIINVTPDLVAPKTYKITRVMVNGEERTFDPNSMTITLRPQDLGHDTDIIVTYKPQPFEVYMAGF